jgi:hypothetical protein
LLNNRYNGRTIKYKIGKNPKNNKESDLLIFLLFSRRIFQYSDHSLQYGISSLFIKVLPLDIRENVKDTIEAVSNSFRFIAANSD